MISKGKPKKFGINPATVQLHPPGIPHEIARDRTGGGEETSCNRLRCVI